MSAHTQDGRTGPGLGGGTFARAAHIDAQPRSVGQLLREIADDLSHLFRSEIALARAETTDKVGRMAGSVAMLAAGGFLGLAALIYVMQAAVYLLTEVMEPWQAALAVGVVVGIVGFVLIKVGQGRMRHATLMPERTLSSVKKDLTLAKEQVS